MEEDLNNNPPVGDFKDGFRCNLKVDLDIGVDSGVPLFLLVVLPPFSKIPVLQRQA